MSSVVDAYVTWVPASVAFMLFTSIWTLLAVAYLVLAPARFPAAAHKFAIGGVEFITMIFWFAAFVAVATRWGNNWWAGRQGTFYSCGVAAIVFSAFNWYGSLLNSHPRLCTDIPQGCLCCFDRACGAAHSQLPQE